MDMFNNPDLVVENANDLEIINPQEDLEINEQSDTSYDAFAQMHSEELKEQRKSDSLGLDEPEYDENGHEIEFEDIDEDLDDIEEHAKSVQEKHIEEQLEQFESFASNFSELPDDLAFTVGDKTLTKADLTGLMNQSEQVTAINSHIQEQAKRNQALNMAVEASFFAAETETNKELKAIQQRLNDPYLPSGEKGLLFDQLQQLQQRQNTLKQETGKYAQVKAQREAQQVDMKIAAVSHELEKKYSSDALSSVVQYGQSQGITVEDMKSNASVPYFEMAMKAQKYDELMNNSKAKVSAKKPTAKSVKSTGRKQAVNKRVGNAEALANKMGTHGLSRQDEINIFNSLVD